MRRGFRPRPAWAAAIGLVAALLAQPNLAQVGSQSPHDDTLNPIPPPPPPKPPPDADEVPGYEPVIPRSDRPWELPEQLLEPLFAKAAVYADYTNKFTCDETARLAKYDKNGEVSSEDLRRYGYLLTRDSIGVREYRQVITKDGTLKAGPVRDEEPFPPAYAWVFLFDRFNEPYFSYRYVDERFDGFDWVYEIQFRGSLPFTDGKDIRQWEGVVLVDAVTYTPIEIQAEPAGQRDRLEARYRQWKQSFNLLGLRTGQKPLGYRASIQFRHRKDGLTFPTELRYDTFQAVSPSLILPTRASTRSYTAYQIFRTETTETVGTGNVEPSPDE